MLQNEVFMWLFRSGLVLFAYVLIIVYTGIRVLALIKYLFPSVKAYVFWLIYAVCGCSYFIVSLLRLSRIWFLHQAVMYTLPFLVYFCLGLMIFELVRFGFRIKNGSWLTAGISAGMTGIALSLAVLTMIFGAFNARYIRTVPYEITLNKHGGPTRGNGLRIALVSDLHIGRIVDRKWVTKIVDAVNKTNADVICIAGDIFDINIAMIDNLEAVAEELRRFNAPLGVYACQGNHDVDRLSMREAGKTDRIKDYLDNAGINFMLDEVVLINDSFYLAGRRDARFVGNYQARKTAAELAANMDKTKPVIFMDHQPVDFPGMEEAGADLILSGHTHGGQFFPGNIVTAIMFKSAGATHYGRWKGRTAQAVVSSGAGLWGPPVRIGTKSEVVVIDVKFKL